MKRLGLAAVIITLALGLLTPPLAAAAEEKGKVYRVGWIINGSCARPHIPVYRRALVEGLRAEGWTEGRNVAIEHRCAEGGLDRLPKLAAELVQLNVDVLMVVAGPAIRAAKNATTTIPIVFLTATAHPVADGFVASFANPGGNATGVALIPTPEFWAKRLQLLTDAVPTAARVGALHRPYQLPLLRELSGAAGALGVELQLFQAAQPPEIDQAFAAMREKRVEALYVAPAPVYWSRRTQIVELAATHRLPATYPARDFVQVGGLMSYGASVLRLFQRAAVHAGKILNGADPATLPVERPTTFEFVINMKTAKALGLTIPPSVLVRADEVIE